MILWRIYVTVNNEMYLGFHVNWPILFTEFNKLWNIWTNFYKISQYKISMEILPVDSDVSKRMDSQTDGEDAANSHF